MADTDRAIVTNATMTPSHPSNTNIGSLPPELFGKIFSYLPSISEGALPLRHILRVCWTWYQLVIHAPRLWTTIVINKASFERYLRHAPTFEAFLRACFIRSAPCAFELHLESFELPAGSSLYDSMAYGALTTYEALTTQIITFAAENHMHRLRHFVWNSSAVSSGWASAQGTKVANVLPSHFPMLEYLSIIEEDAYIWDGRRDLPCFPHSPKLRSLHLVNHLPLRRNPFLRSEDAGRIEKLTLEKHFLGSEWRQFDVTFIAQFRALRVLTLDDNHAEVSWRIRDNRALVELPLLETLVLSGDVPDRLLDSFVIPTLKTIEIQVTKWHEKLLNNTSSAILRSVKNIYVVIKPGSEAPRDELWAPHLNMMIGSAPLLQKVHISSALLEGSMEMENLVRSRDWIKFVGV
jgi:hypothetical protein